MLGGEKTRMRLGEGGETSKLVREERDEDVIERMNTINTKYM